MHVVRNFIGKIDETERGNNAQIFAGLPFDTGKCRQIAPPPSYVRETRNLHDRRVRIGCGGQFRAQQQLGDAHRLIDENLFLISAALGPPQNWLNRDNGWFEFESGL